jgi:tetratricopeptide (TPR) repeat protein
LTEAEGAPTPGIPGAIAPVATNLEWLELQPTAAEATRMFDARRYKEADGLLTNLLADPRFGKIPPARKTAIWLLAGVTAQALGDDERALGLLKLANDSPAALPEGFLDYFFIAGFQERDLDAAAAATTLAKRWPQRALELDERQVYRVSHRLGKDASNRAVRIAYLDALFDAGWQHEDGRQASILWRELARLKLEDGDTPRAIAAAGRVRAADDIVRMRIDKRYDAVMSALTPEQLDIEKAAAGELAVLEAAVQREPRRLEHVMTLTYSLLDLGQWQRVLDICDGVLKTAAAAGKNAPYDDADEYLIWIRDNRSRALVQLGRVDEAAAAWEKARRLPEDGADNVSQAINLAVLYGQMGRTDKALKSLASVRDNVSPFGWMQYHSARLAALMRTPDAPMAVESLDYIRQHRTDSEGTLTDALIVAGRMDEAAQSLIARLENADTRNDALMDVQNFKFAAPTPIVAEILERARQLKARPDVAKAIEAVGRVMDVPLYRVTY